MSTLGERLKEERLALGLTQAQLGKEGGVRKRAQLAYEKGTRAPNAIYLARIAAAGVDVGFVITGETRKMPRTDRGEEALLQTGLSALVERIRTRAGQFDILQSFEDRRPNPGTTNGEIANLLRVGADGLVSLRTLKAEAEAVRRPCAELANNAASAAGFMCRGAIARHATGEVGPDYVGMAEEALLRLDAALAAMPGIDA